MGMGWYNKIKANPEKKTFLFVDVFTYCFLMRCSVRVTLSFSILKSKLFSFRCFSLMIIEYKRLAKHDALNLGEYIKMKLVTIQNKLQKERIIRRLYDSK